MSDVSCRLGRDRENWPADRMISPFTLLTVAGLLVCATLFWLAAELNLAATARPRPMAVAVGGVAVLLGASALWWPAHAAQAADVAGTLPWWACWWPAWLLAAAVTGAGSLWHRGRRRWAVLLAVAAVGAAILQPVVSGRLAGSPWLGIVGALLLALGLTAALIAAQLDWRGRRRAMALRAAAALAAAVCIVVWPGDAAEQGGTVGAAFGPVWPVLLGLIALAAMLRLTLHQSVPADPAAKPSAAAMVDTLTGLPTRLVFESRLEQEARHADAQGLVVARGHGRRAAAIVGAARRQELPSIAFAVLFIDLDGFKPINDGFGHHSGDRVLAQVGLRLKAFARGTGVAARVGGDEFLLLSVGERAPHAVARLAKRLIAALSEPYRVDDREVVISCSIGISLYPDKCPPTKLIARADAAMAAAKRAGGARHSFYTPEMDADVQQNFDLLRDLRLALVKDQLELFFQPKIDARSGKVTGAEALVRWNHPRLGFVMPAQFVPLAERSGLIGPLGDWVIEAACKQARAWRDKGLRMRVAINLSAYQMRQDDIAERIAGALARYRVHPSLLTCEITETAAMEDTGATQETFRRLGELGTHLSIDDFGTGHSSLSYLRQLPAEELKIDASFVKDVDHSADARAVVDAVVKLAHALGLKVVAEGVENLRQHRILVDLGCDELQGYLFAKPMTARALLLWAMDDRSVSAVFRPSLFGETRQASLNAPLQADPS
ncbi:MAG: bifunctional diguanylate cyclase/phosphodiesterase [Pseudomonadota bacterium]